MAGGETRMLPELEAEWRVPQRGAHTLCVHADVPARGARMGGDADARCASFRLSREGKKPQRASIP